MFLPFTAHPDNHTNQIQAEYAQILQKRVQEAKAADTEAKERRKSSMKTKETK